MGRSYFLLPWIFQAFAQDILDGIFRRSIAGPLQPLYHMAHISHLIGNSPIDHAQTAGFTSLGFSSYLRMIYDSKVMGSNGFEDTTVVLGLEAISSCSLSFPIFYITAISFRDYPSSPCILIFFALEPMPFIFYFFHYPETLLILLLVVLT